MVAHLVFVPHFSDREIGAPSNRMVLYRVWQHRALRGEVDAGQSSAIAPARAGSLLHPLTSHASSLTGRSSRCSLMDPASSGARKVRGVQGCACRMRQASGSCPTRTRAPRRGGEDRPIRAHLRIPALRRSSHRTPQARAPQRPPTSGRSSSTQRSGKAVLPNGAAWVNTDGSPL